jgi:UDP-glucose 4-epimerase
MLAGPIAEGRFYWRRDAKKRGWRLMGLRILVTGGAGYIGSATAGLLLKHNHSVTVLDDLSRGNREAVPTGAHLVVGNIGDASCLEKVFSAGRFDAVMHFAAFAEVSESSLAPALYFRNNSANTLTLLEVVLAHNVSRFVFSSTAALYGDPDHVPIVETAPMRPTNPYGESKLQTERTLDWFHRIHGLPYASLRYFNAAGALGERGEDHEPESHLIPLILKAALGQREAVDIYGTDYPTPDGTCIRDFIHIHDLAMAHLLVLNALDKGGKLIFNLGNGSGYSVRETIEAARRVTGREIPVRQCPRRPGDPAVLVASSQKIRKELGWQPRFADLDAIMESAWQWHCAYPQGYRDKVACSKR